MESDQSCSGGSYPAFVGPRLKWAFGYRLRLTGCHLLWHEGFPRWFQAISDRDEIQSTRTYDPACVAFSSRVSSWNVLNEGVASWQGRSDGLRVQGLLDKLGMEAFDLAFTAAKHADRNACSSIMITGSKRTRLNKRRVGSLFWH